MMKLPKFYNVYNKHGERVVGDLGDNHRDFAAYNDGYRLEEVEWQRREHLRTRLNIYRQMPNWFPHLPDHYAHPCVSDARLISFTENPEKGAADVQVNIKPGKYIERYFKGQHDPQKLGTQWAAKFKPEVLSFAKTADEIEQAFNRGPRSCMYYGAEHFKPYGAKFHPVRVYGDSDLQLAYIEREGKITARCLVWPEKMIHGRIYGDEFRIRPLLTQAGYSEGKFIGAKLKAHQVANGYVLPYIDWVKMGSLSEDKQFIIIDDKGPIVLQNQYGVTVRGRYCEFSDQFFREEDFRRVIDEEGDANLWSPSRIEAQAFVCDHDNHYYENSLRIELADGRVWSRPSFNRHGKVCSGNGKNYETSQGREMKNPPQWYSTEYLTTRIKAIQKAA